MKNSSEAKFYPESSPDREQALTAAKQKSDSPGATGVLFPNTKVRLDAIYALYKAAMLQRANKMAVAALLGAAKDGAKEQTALYCAHFLQVFNMGVRRGDYAAAERILYGLHEGSEALPALRSEADIALVAENIAKGEAKRVAGGGAPMGHPSAAEVAAKYTAFAALLTQHGTAQDELRDAQKAVKKLNKEANAVIRKVWSEVESFYCDRPRPAIRERAREWGLIYARKGELQTVNGLVKDAETGLPLAGVQLKFAEGRNKITTDAEGKFAISTTLMKEQVLVASRAGYETQEVTVKLDGKMGMVEVGMRAQ